ncbi:MAG: nitrous oxide-stimulated promoter family protein [Fermentimonas sp.]|jgi:hypothetical protein
MNDEERVVVGRMIDIYCRSVHGCKSGRCEECEMLFAYASGRLDRCYYGENKPACNSCKIHCYKPEMREKIRQVMRFSGPRMLFRYPGETFRHYYKQFFGRKTTRKLKDSDAI